MTGRARLLTLLGLLALASPAAARAGTKGLKPGDRIDLGRAGVAELTRLPGVGEKRARAIVALRSRQPFRRPEDVLQVKGLGPAWFAKVRQHLVVGSVAAGPALPTTKGGAKGGAP